MNKKNASQFVKSSVELYDLLLERDLRRINTTKKLVKKTLQQLKCLGQKELTIHHTFKNEFYGKKEDNVVVRKNMFSLHKSNAFCPNFEFWDSIRYDDSTTLSDMCDDLRSAPEFSNLRAIVTKGFMGCHYSIEFSW